MNNQVLLWLIIIIPWLSVFFLKKGNFRQFMPTALLAIVYSITMVQVGGTLKWWMVKQTPYPLQSLPNVFSLNPVIIMWILQFTYGRFWLYLATEVVTNLLFTYAYLNYFMTSRNVFQFIGLGPFALFIIITVVSILLYWFQMWQDNTFSRSDRVVDT